MSDELARAASAEQRAAGVGGRWPSVPWRSIAWWGAVLVVALVGLVARSWNLDWDQRQHLHPDERHWSLVSASIGATEPSADPGSTDAGYPTLFGPALTWLDGQRSPANPYRAEGTSFVYGPVTLAASRSVAGWLYDGATTGAEPASTVVDTLDAVGLPLLDADGAPRFDDDYQVDLIGRLVGALIDTAAIVVIALAGRRVGIAVERRPGGVADTAGGRTNAAARLGDATGLAAACFYAGTVMAIQHAHYFGAEPALALTSAVCVWAMLRLDRSASWSLAVTGGATVGAAAGAVMAVKFSGLGLAVVPFLLLALLVAVHRRRADALRLGAAVAGALVSFRILCPPAFIGLGWRPNPVFWDDLRASRRAAGGALPPSIQWAARTPVLEASWWLLKFTLGPGLVLCGVVGLVLLWRARSASGRWIPLTVVAAAVVPYGFVFRDIVTSGRYFVPMVPALAIAAGFGAASALAWLERAEDRTRRVGVGCVTLVVVLAVVWPIAFLNGVHAQDHTRIRASDWIATNVEDESVLTIQSWDDGLPLAIDGIDPNRYESVTLESFGPDSVSKMATLAGQLSDVDYVVESSPRVWNSVVRIPARFPSTIRFFEGLDDGTLGFERVATFTSPPQIGPFRLEHGEEAFSVYDHPEVRIWRNVDQLDGAAIFERLDPVAAASAVPVHPADAGANGGMATAAEVAANDVRGTFANDFADAGLWSNQVVQLVGWLIVLVVLAASAWVLLLPLLRTLPDAGVGLAATLAVVVMVATSVVASGWFGLAFGRPLLLTLCACWTVAGGWTGWRRRRTLATTWGERRRTMISAIAVSVVGFAAGVALRAADPDLWHPARGGEKTFELAMLTSVLRSRTIPPPDVWFSGGALNYHYGGSLMVAVPARLMRTTPEVALNLGVGMIAMLAAGAAYSLGALLAADRGRGRPTTGWRDAKAQRFARRGGLLAALFVLVVPNLAIVPSVFRRLIGDERGPLDWWALSRVVPDSPIITEFPAWSFTFGDLHGHLLDLPIVLTTTTMLVLLFRATSARGLAATALVAGLLVGMSRAVNSWDFPLTLGATVLVLALVGSTTSWRRALLAAGAAAFGCVVVWMPYTSRVEIGSTGLELNAVGTPFASFGVQWGLWLAITMACVCAYGVRLTTTRRVVTAVAATGAATLIAVPMGRGVTVIVIGVAAACAWLAITGWRRSAPTIPVTAFAISAVGWTIVAAVEVVVFRDDLSRMNTVFKWWIHAWVLVAAGCAGTVASLLPRWSRVTNTSHAGRFVVVGVGAAALIATSFVVLAVPARLDDRQSPGGLSLDALAVLDAGLTVGDDAGGHADLADDEAMIDWLRDEVSGLPTILEAPGQAYQWIGRVSALTGLPTVIGWPYHLSQQRPSAGSTLGERQTDAERFFRSSDTDARLDVLWRRNVDYVVFGAAERALAGDDAADEIRSLPCLRIVFDDDVNFVAEVDHDCVGPRAIAWSLAHGGTAPDVAFVD